MLLNYTKQEKSKLDTLQSQLKPQLDKAFETFSKAEEEYTDAQQGKRILSDGEAENFKRTQEEYARLLEEYENKRTSIKRKAEAREARYFALHTDELTERLQFEIEAQIVSFGMLQNHEDFRSVYQNDDEIRDRLTSTYGRYLDILEKHDAENYQLIIDFIESSIADKDEITQAYRAKIEELPTESSKATKSSKAQSAKSMEKAVAIRATDFLAPVDKLSQTLFDNSKNPAFYEKQVLLNVGSKGKKTVHALVSINIDKLQGVTVSNDVMVNPYNRSIHNAVVSLYVAGNTHFTPRMIYQAMNGGTREHKP
ncbi:MAG: hypothetical protein IJ587_10265, partial [Synergistaceae bacterium]|nr:hypothetical protein [Synergistaceae bacterium]